MPKGHKTQQTLEKEMAREALREMVFAQLEALVQAQIDNALGIKFLVVRDKTTGRVLRVAENMAKIKLGDAEELVEVYEKDPSVQAFTDLMNRALDKPAEQERSIKVGVADSNDLVARMLEGAAGWRLFGVSSNYRNPLT